MKPAIHDRGRGPEIVGSRITVFDVLAETRAGRSVEILAKEWKLSVEQLEFALKYIDEHREQVERDWEEIQAHNEILREESETKYEWIRANCKPANPELWEKFQRFKAARAANESTSSRRESSGSNGPHPKSSGGG